MVRYYFSDIILSVSKLTYNIICFAGYLFSMSSYRPDLHHHHHHQIVEQLVYHVSYCIVMQMNADLASQVFYFLNCIYLLFIKTVKGGRGVTSRSSLRRHYKTKQAR